MAWSSQLQSKAWLQGSGTNYVRVGLKQRDKYVLYMSLSEIQETKSIIKTSSSLSPPLSSHF